MNAEVGSTAFYVHFGFFKVFKKITFILAVYTFDFDFVDGPELQIPLPQPPKCK